MDKLPLAKPIKKEKTEKWGVYRKNPKPITNNALKEFRKNQIALVMKGEWIGHPLLEPWSVGKKLGFVTPELYQEVMDRSKGKCELCGKLGECVHHIVGKRRVAWIGNLIMLCKYNHDQDGSNEAIHHTKGWIYHFIMKALQDVYFDMGFTKDEVIYLLGTKSGRLF